jgi:hypothetical protein
MKIFFNFIFLIIRVFVIVKVFYLLYNTKEKVENTNDLIWWSCFLVFDVWLQISSKMLEDKNSE